MFNAGIISYDSFLLTKEVQAKPYQTFTELINPSQHLFLSRYCLVLYIYGFPMTVLCFIVCCSKYLYCFSQPPGRTVKQQDKIALKIQRQFEKEFIVNCLFDIFILSLFNHFSAFLAFYRFWNNRNWYFDLQWKCDITLLSLLLLMTIRNSLSPILRYLL